jgi:tetratricopeptide (TPR) repeat protein
MLNWDQYAPNIELEQRAIECLDKSIEIDPNYANAWGVKGNAVGKLAAIEKIESRKKRMYEEALECFDKAIEIDPELASVLTAKGSVFVFLGKNEKAIECFDKAIEIDPNLIEWVKKIKKQAFDLGPN